MYLPIKTSTVSRGRIDRQYITKKYINSIHNLTLQLLTAIETNLLKCFAYCCQYIINFIVLSSKFPSNKYIKLINTQKNSVCFRTSLYRVVYPKQRKISARFNDRYKVAGKR